MIKNYKTHIKKYNKSKTKRVIEKLQEKCYDIDCSKYNCKTCPLAKKSIELFGIDVLTIDKGII